MPVTYLHPHVAFLSLNQRLMKKNIAAVNQYLLERYPVIWNTRILWMLGAAMMVHLLFFGIGVITLLDPKSLKGYNVMQSYFQNGMLLLGLVISLVLLVVWLVTLFRNNSFKNFYPTSALDLFKHFCAYVVIIFSCTSFYYSYTLGLQCYIKTAYAQERILEEQQIANDSDMFTLKSVYNYTLDERVLPQQLDTLYCESRELSVDTTQAHFKFKDALYQFYSFKKVVVLKDKNEVIEQAYRDEVQISRLPNVKQAYSYVQQDSLASLSLRKTETDSTITYYFKNNVVDVSALVKNAIPSLYNYTNVFYEKGNSDYYSTEIYYEDTAAIGKVNPVDATTINQVRRNHALLDKNDPKAIKSLLQKQLDLLDYYGVEHNLTTAVWFDMIYHPREFTIKHTIADSKNTVNDKTFLQEDATELEKFVQSLQSKRYMEKADLRTVFENFDDVYNTNIFEGSIHVFLWLSVFIASIIFIFRTTGLRELLFAAVASGILFIVIALLGVLLTLVIASGIEEYMFLYLPCTVGFLFFLCTALLYKSVRKLISGVLLNITFVYLLPWLFLIIAIISAHQHDLCLATNYKNDVTLECETILEQVGIWWSYIFIALTLVWVYVYAHVIRSWRVLPEQ